MKQTFCTPVSRTVSICPHKYTEMLHEIKVSTLDQNCHSGVIEGANYRDFKMRHEHLWFCNSWFQKLCSSLANIPRILNRNTLTVKHSAKIHVFWYMTLCHWVSVYQHFQETRCLQIQVLAIQLLNP